MRALHEQVRLSQLQTEDLIRANRQIRDLETAVGELSSKLLKALQDKGETHKTKQEDSKTLELITEKHRIMS